MAVYSYQAIRPDESTVNGSIASDSPAMARRELRDQGLTVIHLRELKRQSSTAEKMSIGDENRTTSTNKEPKNKTFWSTALVRTPGKRSQAKVAGFLGELSTLLAVGVPLVDGLTTLIGQYKGWYGTRLMQLREAIQSGQTFSSAMAKQPDLFDELSLSLVEVGENTGRLDESLRCLADFKRRSVEFRDRVLNALLYPLIIFVMSIGVSIFLMTVVVPTLLANLADLGKELPWPTRVLKFISDSIVQQGWWLVLLFAATTFGVVAILRTRTGKRLRDELVSRVPLLGTMSRKQEISRVALVIATLISSGLDLLRALEIASRTSGNVLLQDSLGIIIERIRTGRELGDSMAHLKYFPPLVSQVFAVGQKSGRLEEMLLRLSDDYDKQVTSMSNRMAVIVEPILIVFLSVIVGFILFATLLPILEAGNVL